mmetsp:Transcript_963/g.3347  ORF Transcript_963/g.3347 Transcript_963/m.3347 type:complete len:238 (-) Transcript_963:7-720(-)
MVTRQIACAPESCSQPKARRDGAAGTLEQPQTTPRTGSGKCSNKRMVPQSSARSSSGPVPACRAAYVSGVGRGSANPTDAKASLTPHVPGRRTPGRSTPADGRPMASSTSQAPSSSSSQRSSSTHSDAALADATGRARRAGGSKATRQSAGNISASSMRRTATPRAAASATRRPSGDTAPRRSRPGPAALGCNGGERRRHSKRCGSALDTSACVRPSRSSGEGRAAAAAAARTSCRA